MTRLRYSSSFLLLVALVVTATGCDAVASKLGIDKVNVPLSGVGALGVNGETPVLKGSVVSRDGGKLPNVFDIKSVALTPADVAWVTTSKSSAASGTVYIAILIKNGANDVPFVFGTATVTNDVVTAISPSLYALTDLAKAAIAKLPAAERPDLSYANGKTASQIAGEVETALRGTGLDVKLVGYATPGLKGNITINKIQVNLDF